MKNLLLKLIPFYLIIIIPATLFSSDHTLILECIEPPIKNCISPMIDNLLRTTTTSSKVRTLIQEIKDKKGIVKLALVNDQQALTAGNYADATKTISIRKSQMSDPLNFCEVLLWEMCNSVNPFLKYPSEFCRNPNEYAFFTEAAEHQSLKRRSEILVDYFEVLKGTDIGKTIEVTKKHTLSEIQKKLLEDPLLSFRGYWMGCNRVSHQDTVSHADNYRNFFNENALYYVHNKDFKDFNEDILELVKSALTEWKPKEDIPFISEEDLGYYRNLIK